MQGCVGFYIITVRFADMPILALAVGKILTLYRSSQNSSLGCIMHILVKKLVSSTNLAQILYTTPDQMEEKPACRTPSSTQSSTPSNTAILHSVRRM